MKRTGSKPCPRVRCGKGFHGGNRRAGSAPKSATDGVSFVDQTHALVRFRDCYVAQRVLGISSPTGDQQVCLAVVWRNPSGLDHLFAIFPGVVVRRLLIRTRLAAFLFAACARVHSSFIVDRGYLVVTDPAGRLLEAARNGRPNMDLARVAFRPCRSSVFRFVEHRTTGAVVAYL